MKQIIKSFCVYTVGDLDSLAKYNSHLAKITYKPCQGAEPISRGFSPMTEDSMLLTIQNFEIGCVKIMQRSVPKSEVDIQFKDLKATKEAELNRPLEKAEATALKIAVEQKLMTQAFPKRSEVYFILDKVNHYLYIGATATSQVENVLLLLSNAVDTFTYRPFISDINPSDALTSFVRGLDANFNEEFEIGDQVVLEEDGAYKITWNEDASKARQNLQNILSTGRYVTAVGLKREDESLQFKVDEYLHFSGLKFSKDYFTGEYETQNGDLLLLASAVRDLFVDITDLMKGEQTETEE